jgi:glycylpeptide N-tetradecanoyltransferase
MTSPHVTVTPVPLMSSQNEKVKATEVDTVNPDPEEMSNSDSEREVIVQDETVSSTSQKKKKKKKKKFLLGGGKDEIPQNLVDHVLDRVKEDGAVTGSDNLNAENVREALEQLKIMEVAKGKVGLGGVNKKDVGEHKVR